VLGKGLGAGLPIAAIIIRDGLEGFSLKAEELHTFANNSASQVAAAKQIEVIERDNLLKNTREMGAYLAEGLRALQPEFPEMGDIRALGLHIGVEYENPQTKEPRADMAVGIRDEGLKLGAIFGLGGARKNVLKVKPPLIVTRGECDDILRILRQSMQRALRQ